MVNNLAVLPTKHANVTRDVAWVPTAAKIHIGKDILELLSSSMYVDPMTIYREYIQNAADALDEMKNRGRPQNERPTIEIAIDPQTRTVRIRDNGTGISANQFVSNLCNLGASSKRGTSARGFRGVGRLAGLGYCQELVFRSRAAGDKDVSEMLWDCRGLKAQLRSATADKDIAALIREVVSVRQVKSDGYPAGFFEVELRSVVRHRNDKLLSASEVGKYLTQVAPVPFAPNFRFAEKICEALRGHVETGDVEIYVNGAEKPLYRPHRNKISPGDEEGDRFTELELHTFDGVDGTPAAVAWVLHHGYTGALPNDALIKGIRLRVGNVQIGEHALLEELFPEPRFNAWSVGEIHIFDRRVVPNGRRDHFEQNVHFDNILNQLGPIARDITRRCRQSSIVRKWLRDFELQEAKALSEAKFVSRRGITKTARQQHMREATRALAAMKKVAAQRNLPDDAQVSFVPRIRFAELRIAKLSAKKEFSGDPFARFTPPVRNAYKKMIDLIYQCATNPKAADRLVEKILDQLDRAGQSRSTSRKEKPKSRR